MGKKNMTYPSWTRAERAKQKRLERQREAELLKRVNERLAAIGINHSELLRLIVEGKVEVKIKESEK